MTVRAEPLERAGALPARAQAAALLTRAEQRAATGAELARVAQSELAVKAPEEREVHLALQCAC